MEGFVIEVMKVQNEMNLVTKGDEDSLAQTVMGFSDVAMYRVRHSAE